MSINLQTTSSFSGCVPVSSCSKKSLDKQLENIDESIPAVGCLPPLSSCPAPETPTESMEFLARSWTLSAMELSKALSSNTHVNSLHLDKLSFCSSEADLLDTSSVASKDSLLGRLRSAGTGSPTISPRDSEEMKLYKKGRTMGRWLKDQKERKKHEIRIHNAQLHAAVSVAGVAAAVAAVAASSAMSVDFAATQYKAASKTSTAMASATALVASACIEIAEDMGAEREQILTAISSAINAKTSGDIMTLTAGAATALRGAATLRARLEKGCGATAFMLREEKGEEDKVSNITEALNFVARGGELLKRTRKGALHWTYTQIGRC